VQKTLNAKHNYQQLDACRDLIACSNKEQSDFSLHINAVEAFEMPNNNATFHLQISTMINEEMHYQEFY